ncbi:uncharacterized protein LOC113312511 [Papaver somniferum]|uniref:uncharacterized protein LOC113312511 n=1 Tax=Papaver somniferum TaxID=3469 RepID=UPI000E701909|nr:uncharacterized protein LOC113312511 [Papaver somniferum]
MEKSLQEMYPENDYILQFPEMKVPDFILDDEWIVPAELMEMININDLPVVSEGREKTIWTGTITGQFIVASTMEVIRQKLPSLHWTKKVWHKFIHPSISSNVWKLARNICATDDNMKKRKFNMVSRCILCRKEEETRDHILWYCNYSEIIWSWLGGIFNFKNPRSFEDILQLAKNKSLAIKEIWILSAFITMKELWFLRNDCTFGKGKCDQKVTKEKITKAISDSDLRLTAKMWNKQYDLQVLKFFGLKTRGVKNLIIKEVFFQLPEHGKLLLCYDGASRGNPGCVVYGIVVRINTGDFVIPISGGLGISTNYYAEIFAILMAGEWAIHHVFKDLVFRTDSKDVISAFQSNKLPWFVVTRWGKICAVVIAWSFKHSYKEVNFSADTMAKRGARLRRGEQRIFGSKPSFLSYLENTDQVYFRFC